MIKIAPTCLIISWFAFRNPDINDAEKPSIIKILENPIRKKMVCSRLFLLSLLLSSCTSLTLIPVIYDKKAGNRGNTHGETKDKKPAPKAIKILISDIISLLPNKYYA
jgi:hypothetical protein